MKPEPASDRTAMLRAALVDTVDAEPARRVGPRQRFVIAAIAAFALAGAGTGGAISAFAAGTGDPDPTETVTISSAAFADSMLGSHAQTMGTPFIVAGSGKVIVELGERPDGATSLLLITSCVDFGHLDYAIDGEWAGSLDCVDDGEGERPGGAGGFTSIDGDGTHRLSLDGEARYVVWAAWAADQADPEPSAAQQAEMADGVVTYEEYHAAFARFEQCMSDAGYPVIGAAQVGDLIHYATSNEANTTGVDRQCYVAEFMTVDSTWQIAHEDTSETAQILRDCLAEHGIEPPQRMEDIHAALEVAGLSIEDCAP